MFTPLNSESGSYTVNPLPMPVGVEIRPFMQNVLSLWPSWELIPVAVLSTKTFDATRLVDKQSLTFGNTGDEESMVYCDQHQRDVNRDRYPDLVCYFQKQQTAFGLGDTKGILKGKTVKDIPLQGQDAVTVVSSFWPIPEDWAPPPLEPADSLFGTTATDKGTSADDQQIQFGTPGKDKIKRYGNGGNDQQIIEGDAGDD